MFGMEHQSFMLLLSSVFLKPKEDPTKMLRSLFASIHQQRTLPPKRFLERRHAEAEAVRKQSPDPQRAAGKRADLELSPPLDRAGLSSLPSYHYSFIRRKHARFGQRRRQMDLPLAVTWVGYRQRSPLRQALQEAEDKLKQACSEPQAAYALSWSECVAAAK